MSIEGRYMLNAKNEIMEKLCLPSWDTSATILCK